MGLADGLDSQVGLTLDCLSLKIQSYLISYGDVFETVVLSLESQLNTTVWRVFVLTEP